MIVSAYNTFRLSEITFMQYQYMTAICYSLKNQSFIFCIDTNSNMLLIFKQCYDIFFNHLSLIIMFNNHAVSIFRINSSRSKFIQFVYIKIFIKIVDDKSALLEEEFHIISNLTCNLLIAFDILVSVKTVLNLKTSVIIFYDQFEILIQVLQNQTKSFNLITQKQQKIFRLKNKFKKRIIIKATELKIISSNKKSLVSVTHRDLNFRNM